jgi:hypothetical protein
MMYCRNGGIEVADTDAIATCNQFPNEWTRKPWIRPDGRPDVYIRPDWATAMGNIDIIELARSTAGKIDTAEQAVSAISEYLAGTRHPDMPPTNPSS